MARIHIFRDVFGVHGNAVGVEGDFCLVPVLFQREHHGYISRCTNVFFIRDTFSLA